MTARERQDQVIEDFGLIEDPLERFQVIVETAGVGAFPEQFRTDDHLVPGCTSRVWLAAWSESNLVKVALDSEAPALRGVGALFERIYTESTKDEILDLAPVFIDRLGIDRQLTPTRRRGIANIRRRLVEIVEGLDR